MSKPKVLILADIPGWIVDRITDRMIEGLPNFEFTKRYYTAINGDELVALGNAADLIHYQNTDIRHGNEVWKQITTPTLVSIRSHRYPKRFITFAERFNPHLHTLSYPLKIKFPSAHYIPDGIFEMFKRPFVVGYAGKPDDYKGFDLIREACELENVVFKPAIGDTPPEEMPSYYKSLDLYICASKDEGHSTTVMEALAMNVPVGSTEVGYANRFGIDRITRSVEGIRGIIKHYNTSREVEQEFWENRLPAWDHLYNRLAK